MAIFRIPMPPAILDRIRIDPDYADELPLLLTNHLRAQGVTVIGVSIYAPPPSADPLTDISPPALIIEADSDPTEAMAAYADTPTPRELAFTLLRRIVRDIRNPTQFPRTAAERLNDVERAIVALVAIERLE